MDGFVFQKQVATEIELLPEEMGAKFAEGDSRQQAKFLNEAFNVMDSWADNCGVWQISYIAKYLSPNSKNYLRELVAHFDDE